MGEKGVFDGGKRSCGRLGGEKGGSVKSFELRPSGNRRKQLHPSGGIEYGDEWKQLPDIQHEFHVHKLWPQEPREKL